ncbi:C39 family peptidase [Cystobacter fuscus]|uniref:C39 family peptidase n=1 Tax=Cystobacter fuscus TaxID=43 RepID=UPI002B2A4301|nr:hypothetical protein F0U63_27850 [Cystobacter fuscus]
MRSILRGALASLVMVFSAANAGTLPVPLFPQETNQWCWAGSGQMIMNYLGATRVSQCDQANRRLGRSDCCNSPVPSACVQPGWPEFEKYGFAYNTTSNSALSWSSLVSEINANRPVGFSWGWTGGGGHMMVASGYLTLLNTNYVYVNDPWAPNVGDQYYITYSEYVSGADHVHWRDYYNIRENPPCYSDFHNLSASSFQGCFDHHAWRDRWPVTLTAYNSSGSRLMAGSFQAAGSRPVRVLMTTQQFQSYFETYRAQGWRPDRVSVLPTSSGPLFSVIWAPIDGAFLSLANLTEAEMSAKWSEMWNAGYLNVDLAVYNDNGVIRFSGVWVKKAHNGYATYWHMTAADFESKKQSFAAQGLMPVRFNSYSTPNGIRYAATWHPSSSGFYQAYNMTSAGYQSTYDYVAGLNQGYRLSHVSALDGVLSALWTK